MHKDSRSCPPRPCWAGRHCRPTRTGTARVPAHPPAAGGMSTQAASARRRHSMRSTQCDKAQVPTRPVGITHHGAPTGTRTTSKLRQQHGLSAAGMCSAQPCPAAAAPAHTRPECPQASRSSPRGGRRPEAACRLAGPATRTACTSNRRAGQPRFNRAATADG